VSPPAAPRAGRGGTRAVLLVSCPDQKGLVATVADFVFRHGGNIVDADQHTDFEQGRFLQRVEWETDGFGLAREEVGAAFRPIAERFGMTWELRFTDRLPRMAVMVSRLDHCLYDLLWRQRSGELAAEIPLVVSNHPELRPVAESFGVPFHVQAVTAETKAAAERETLERLEACGADLVVLARYMQVLGPAFVERYRNRLINIHHSFLPAFAGGRPYHQAYERGVKVIGATSHYVTEALDEGPIIEQDVIRVSHRDDAATLARHGADIERTVLARAVRWHCEDRLLRHGTTVVVF